jgi:hypothetical protein
MLLCNSLKLLRKPTFKTLSKISYKGKIRTTSRTSYEIRKARSLFREKKKPKMMRRDLRSTAPLIVPESTRDRSRVSKMPLEHTKLTKTTMHDDVIIYATILIVKSLMNYLLSRFLCK